MKGKKDHLDTSFIDWINSVGASKIAKTLDVYESTVRHWRAGNVLPRALQMKKIKELTKGRIDYVHIIEGSNSPLANK